MALQRAYIDVNGIYNNISRCKRCFGPTDKICLGCKRKSFCEECYTISHRYIVLGGHKLQNDVDVEVQAICTTHEGEFMDYYCWTCQEIVCVLCMVARRCMFHQVAPVNKINHLFLSDIIKILPLLELKMRRLTKAASVVGKEYMKLEIAGQLNTALEWLETQPGDAPKPRIAFMAAIVNINNKQKAMLRILKSIIHIHLQRAKRILNTLQLGRDPTQRNKTNFVYIYESAKKIVSCPWILSREAEPEIPELSPDEEVCRLVKLYMQSHMIHGEPALTYMLFKTSELPEGSVIPPPPSTPILPPEGVF